MATTSVPTRKAASASTSGRLNLEDWAETKAPLSAAEKLSVSRLQEAIERRQRASASELFDARQAALEEATQPLANVLPEARLASSPPPGASPCPSAPVPDIMSLSAPITTPQSFLDWFSRVGALMEHEQEDIYRRKLAEISAYRQACDELLEELRGAAALVDEIQRGWTFVKERSKALQDACENLLDEQNELLQLTDAIDARLQYFAELESATRMLNLPGESLVLQDDFLTMLERLDVCLEFLRAHREYKDAEIYLIRFQQCMTRSMTLIKMYFVSVMRSLGSDVQKKLLVSKDHSPTTRLLLYSKFSSQAPTLRGLIFELEKRAVAIPDEYGSLLAECHSAWFGVRHGLLIAGVTEDVKRLDPFGADLVRLTQDGCGYLKQLCADEYDLYRQFFSTDEDAAYRHLEGLCSYLYDSLRPRLLREEKLEALCEACTIMQAFMVPTLGEEEEQEEDEKSTVPAGQKDTTEVEGEEGDGTKDEPEAVESRAMSPQQHQGLQSFQFKRLLQPLLHDAQTRLTFRAQAVMQSEVSHFIPKDKDLDYPGKLKTLSTTDQRETHLLGRTEVDADGALHLFRMPPEEVVDTWYPSVRKTLWILSKLYTIVNDSVFIDMAQEAITLCRQSLSTATSRLATRRDGEIDAALFHIRHLLLLKEMLASIDLTQVDGRLPGDSEQSLFYWISDALYNLLRNPAALLDPVTLYGAASKGGPQAIDHATTAKLELDRELKRVCEDLISECAKRIARPLLLFLDKVAQYSSSAKSGAAASDGAGVPRDLTEQEWATSDKVKEIYNEFRHSCDVTLRDCLARMRLYLTDDKTVAVMLLPLQDETLDVYRPFLNLVRSEYDFVVSSALSTPTDLKVTLQQTCEVFHDGGQ